MKYLECKKVIILIALYVFGVSIGGSLLSRTGILWIQRNLTSVVYSVLFFIALSFFGQDLIRQVRKIDERGFEQLVIIGFLTLAANVSAGIFLSSLSINNSNENALNTMTDHNVILLKLATILFAPVVEELVYRYGIYGLFGKYRLLGTIITTFLFAFSHVWGYVLIEGQWNQLIAMLPYLAFGLGLNILYLRTQNVLYPIMLHMIINAIAALS